MTITMNGKTITVSGALQSGAVEVVSKVTKEPTHNQSEQQVMTNKPGYWVLACFMNTQDGREHTQLGMERVIRIVK
jgi:hypothetical protein